MVRLKDDQGATTPLNMFFQFHYGTIKSHYKLICLENLQNFQFHYGTIKRRLVNACDRAAYLSIPLWYD